MFSAIKLFNIRQNNKTDDQNGGVLSQILSIYLKGPFKYLKIYIENFTLSYRRFAQNRKQKVV